MKYVSTFAVVLTIVLSGSAQVRAVHAVTEPERHAPLPNGSREVSYEVRTADVEQVDLALWAAGRYEAAGLELPPVTVFFHDDTEACLGNYGLHTPLAEGRRVDICVRGEALETRFLLHELAHAWVSEHFAPERRDAFLELRGLAVWHDNTYRWNRQGTEHAAEIIAWGVAEETRLPGRITNHDLGSVTESFRFLTGREPISTTLIEDSTTVGAAGGPQA